jgi:hypothetical protein
VAAISALAMLSASSTSAMAAEIIKLHKDKTNTYFVQPMSTDLVTSSGSIRVLESPVVITDSDTRVIREVTSPVVIHRSTTGNVVIEDQLVKEKHLFSINLKPLFHFYIK